MQQVSELTAEAVAEARRKNIAIAVVAVAIVALAIAAHVKIASDVDDYVGRLAIADRVFDVLFATSLVAVCFSTGRYIISRFLNLDFFSRIEEFCFSVFLGAGTLSTAVLLLGLAHGLKPLPVALLFILVIAVTRKELSLLLKIGADLRVRALETRTSAFVATAFLIMAVILLMRALLPPTDADESIYHLAAPAAFVARGRIFPLFDNFLGDMPLLLHMLYSVCLVAKSDIAARLLSLMLALTTALALYAFCLRFVNKTAGYIALFAFFGAGMVVEVAVTARIDVSLAGMLFLTTYGMMVSLKNGNRRWLLLSAMLAGFSLAVKLTAGIWIIFVIVMYLWEGIRSSDKRWTTTLANVFLYGAIAVLILSPWLVKNAVWFHNPVYPIFTGEARDTEPIDFFTDSDQQRVDEYFQQAQREIPDSVASAERTLQQSAALRPVRHPMRFWDYFIHPANYTVAESYHDPNYLFVLAPLFLLFFRRRWLVWLGICAAGYYVVLVQTAWVARYLLPLYPALTVLAACAIAGLIAKLSPRVRLAPVLFAAVVAVAVGSALLVCLVRVYDTRGSKFLIGDISRSDFLHTAFYYGAFDLINHTLPQDAKILSVGFQPSYGLHRDVIRDPGWDATGWRRILVRHNTLAGVDQELKDQGINYILFNPGLFSFVAQIGKDGSGLAGTKFKKSSLAHALIGGGSENVEPKAGPNEPDYQDQLEDLVTFELFSRTYLDALYFVPRCNAFIYKVK